MPVEGLRRHRAAPRIEVFGRRYAAELLPQLAQEPDELLAGCETPRHEPGLPLGSVPAAEVLDHGLRMDHRLLIGRELPHRRRAAEPLSGCAQLGEDLLV